VETTNFTQKEYVVQTLTYDTVICKRQSSIDQFCEGLRTGNIWELIKSSKLDEALVHKDNSEEFTYERISLVTLELDIQYLFSKS
jgi:hypothetical protein